MLEAEIQPLLYRRESESLDFKRQQYPFTTTAEKAELLKDVLAFANAWRSTTAYILIGVDDSGSEPQVVGIPPTDHLSDSDLQQFVNSKTSQPVRFGYQRVHYRGVEIGVLMIEHPQSRPIFLLKPYGALRDRVVYLRRGSSTDEAPPDEIAAMGRAEAQAIATPSITLEFAENGSERRLGTALTLSNIKLEVRSPTDPRDQDDDHDQIRDPEELVTRVGEPRRGSRWGKRADEIERLAGMRSVRFWLENASPVTAEDINVVIDFPPIEWLELMSEERHPRHAGGFATMPPFNTPRVRLVEDRWRVEFRVAKLQPRASTFTHPLYLRAMQEGSFEAAARIFADNLSDPILVPLGLTLTLTEQSLSYHRAGRLWDRLVK